VKKLWQRSFEGEMHVQLFLCPLEAEFAATQKSDDRLVIGVGLDVRLLLEPLPDGLHVRDSSFGVLVQIIVSILPQFRGKAANRQIVVFGHVYLHTKFLAKPHSWLLKPYSNDASVISNYHTQDRGGLI